MESEGQSWTPKYPVGNIEGLEIVERKSPGGFSQRYIIIDGNYHLLEFFRSGFVPDPRTHFPELRNMEVFDNDILIAAFLKCGTHWVWEMVKMLLKGKPEYEKRPKEVAMLEFHSVDELKTEKHPRVFNTHLYPTDIPKAFLEGKGKVLFLLRNPKDITVSYYHHWKDLKLLSPAQWDDFLYFMINYGGVYSNWFDYTNVWDREIQKGKQKYLCLHYEELIKNPVDAVRSIAKYLETPCSDALADDIVQHCKIEKMRSANRDKFDDRNQTPPNPEMYNPDLMYRKGKVGDWKNYFTVAQNEEIEKVLKERMKDSSFKFDYE